MTDPARHCASCTCNNVTVNITAAGGMTLSPEQIRGLVADIQQQLRKQARRNRKPEDGSDGEAAAA